MRQGIDIRIETETGASSETYRQRQTHRDIYIHRDRDRYQDRDKETERGIVVKTKTDNYQLNKTN